MSWLPEAMRSRIDDSLSGRWIARLRGALDGKPVIDCDGNTYAVDADGESATFTDLIDESVETFPTATVLEAIEGWLAFGRREARPKRHTIRRRATRAFGITCMMQVEVPRR